MRGLGKPSGGGAIECPESGCPGVVQPVSRSTYAMVPLGASEFRRGRAARGQPLRVDLDTADAGEAWPRPYGMAVL